MKSFFILVAFLITFSVFQGIKNGVAAVAVPPETENRSNDPAPSKPETSEEKAVRLAEEFIRRNGYTDAPADRNDLAHETVEFSETVDDLLKLRHDTLEPKAYGIRFHGENGWTIVFRYSARIVREFEESPVKNSPVKIRATGRAVTMDGNFENLEVKHKDFFLDKVDKKF